MDPKEPSPTESKFSTVSVKQLTIAPGDVQRIDLSEELDRLGINGPFEVTGVDVTYDGPVGSLIGQLTSSDQSADYSFEVPIKDPSDPTLMIESAISLDNRKRHRHSVASEEHHGQERECTWCFRVFWTGSYNLPHMTLQPYQSIAVDIQTLKDSKKPDVLKQPFPSDASHGQLAWHQEIPATMIGRAEQTNCQRRHLQKLSCPAGCCEYYSFSEAWFDPGSLMGVVGGGATFDGYESFTSCGDYVLLGLCVQRLRLGHGQLLGGNCRRLWGRHLRSGRDNRHFDKL